MRYLGNKTRILDNIKHVLNDNNIQGEIFCDLFAGSGAVGDLLKEDYLIISNDFLTSMYIINNAKLLNNRTPLFTKFIEHYNITPFEYFNNKNYTYEEHYFVTNQYSPKGKRMFFTEKNAIKIDGIRLEIEELFKSNLLNHNERVYLIASLLESVMSISNTSGTYEAYLKQWDKRALKDLILKPLQLNNTNKIKQNIVYNTDSNTLLREISGDILYIDTPYTVTDYNSAYHILESIAKYDYPEVGGITGRRKVKQLKSKYTRKETALKNFEDLFRQAQFKDIIVSYSTQGLIEIEALLELAKKFSVKDSIKLYKFPYREYKNIRSSNKGSSLYEIIIYFKKDNEAIRAPLNYSGSKYELTKELIKILPKHMSSFVDMMGGAFNVGVNIVANQVVYNEVLPHTYNIIKYLLSLEDNEIIKTIEEIIHKYSLSKSNKESYLKLREDFNHNKEIEKLFVLHMFCFQNQMRFNSKMEFNTPIGNCSYNATIRDRILKFKPKTSNYVLYNKSYKEIDYKQYDYNTVFYFDPPYFITNATYNDGKRGFIGWNAEEEARLLDYITELHLHGYRFILSNVLDHKNKKNNILYEWIQTHQFQVKHIGKVGTKMVREEVVITNYDWRNDYV